MKRQAVLDASRKSAFESIQNALKIEPEMKSFIRTMWDPTTERKNQPKKMT